MWSENPIWGGNISRLTNLTTNTSTLISPICVLDCAVGCCYQKVLPGDGTVFLATGGAGDAGGEASTGFPMSAVVAEAAGAAGGGWLAGVPAAEAACHAVSEATTACPRRLCGFLSPSSDCSLPQSPILFLYLWAQALCSV